MSTFLDKITSPTMLARLQQLCEQRPDIQVLRWMIGEAKFLEWAHTVGVCADDELRACVPPFPPLEVRRWTAAAELESFLWTGLVDTQLMLALYNELKNESAPPRPTILDFGCGCGRMIRFLSRQPEYWSAHGCDVKPGNADWCSANLPGAKFTRNAVLPPLPYRDGTFDLVFSLSIFTHLAEKNANLWLEEIHRVLAPQGVFLATTSGLRVLETTRDSALHQEMFKVNRQRTEELIAELPDRKFIFLPYDQGILEAADAGEEYGNTFIHPSYLQQHWGGRGFEVLRHIPAGLRGWQDVVVLQRRQWAQKKGQGTMATSITQSVASGQHIIYNSEVISALPERAYTFRAGPIQARGQEYAAYLLAIALDEQGRELARYVRWIQTGGAARDYRLVFRTPPATRGVVLGYRVNAETPVQGPLELVAPAAFSADMLCLTDQAAESVDRLTDHLEPLFLGRMRATLDANLEALDASLETISRRLEEDNARKTWNKGIEPEAAHWRNYLLGIKELPEEQYRLDPNQPLAPTLTDLLNPNAREPARILDVGAGPLTTLGKVWPGHQLALVAVDPLADFYDRALAEVGIVPPVRTIYAEAEQLSAHFPPDSFDLVVCANALDHCYNPFKAIDEMLKVAKPGASILLVHFPNEAENECYSGFHQWNFWGYRGNFVVWNRKGVYVANRVFAGRARVSITEANQLIVVLRKLEGIAEPCRKAG